MYYHEEEVNENPLYSLAVAIILDMNLVHTILWTPG